MNECGSFSTAGEINIDPVVNPAEIGISAQAVIRQVAVRQEPGGQVGLFTVDQVIERARVAVASIILGISSIYGRLPGGPR